MESGPMLDIEYSEMNKRGLSMKGDDGKQGFDY